MGELGKILVVSQHYPPDPTTTATYVGDIARALASDRSVVVLSGSPNSASADAANPQVIEIARAATPKDALARRAIAISWLAIRMFVATLRRARRDDVVFCVTTPFTLPYGVMLAAGLRGAATALLIYDLYPEALQAAGLAKPSSLTVRLIRRANAMLFRRLDAIITIGRDVAPLLLAYDGVAREKIHFIPNWTLLPAGYRAVAAGNRFRAGRQTQLIVGLSGNLGFTHDPRTMFEAARLLRDNADIHFLLSGWGVGWHELSALQAKEQLGNVTLLPPVSQHDLIDFLSAADVWVIPYRRNIAGVSIPSRLYNLLAIGRAIVVAAEPNTEAALVIDEEKIGWVVPPEQPAALAEAIALAARDRAGVADKGRRAATAAANYGPAVALARYRAVIMQAGSREQRS
jgi:putative colanic acid biosynthesis glycosyltransferase WcaI